METFWTCSLCLYHDEQPVRVDSNTGKSYEVLTIINGQLVCEEHAAYVQGGEHAEALRSLVTDRP
jgi:hypothetical protein